jgi:hypothetical protein
MVRADDRIPEPLKSDGPDLLSSSRLATADPAGAGEARLDERNT